METQNFWQKYQVLISSIAGALVIVLQQFIMQSEIDYKALGLAVLMAIAGVVGNEFRGKGVTVAGFIGIVATAFLTIQTTGNFTWAQFGLSVLVGFLAMVAPPAKSAQYEQTPIIKEAKKEATEMKAAQKAQNEG